MKWHRVHAYTYRHWLELRASIDRKTDVLFFPLIDILLFGFLSQYIDQNEGNLNIAPAILAGIIFWTLLYNISHQITFTFLDDVWSRNTFNLFATPLRISEVIAGVLILSFVKAFFIVLMTTAVVSILFSFDLFSLGFSLAWYLIHLFFFGWAVGFFTSGLIMRYGIRVQAAAWSLILILYPFSGALYPASVLPDAFATLARIIPVSYIFDGLRDFFIHGQGMSPHSMIVISVLNALYLTGAVIFYVRGHMSARNRGWYVHPS